MPSWSAIRHTNEQLGTRLAVRHGCASAVLVSLRWSNPSASRALTCSCACVPRACAGRRLREVESWGFTTTVTTTVSPCCRASCDVFKRHRHARHPRLPRPRRRRYPGMAWAPGPGPPSPPGLPPRRRLSFPDLATDLRVRTRPRIWRAQPRCLMLPCLVADRLKSHCLACGLPRVARGVWRPRH